ncbi:MAG: OB-fold nucleic acid binding domain-containing protein [Nitrospirota bacterium]
MKKRGRMIGIVAAVLLFVMQTVYAQPQQTTGEQSTASAAAAPKTLSGKVVETMTSGNYTYMLLEKNGTQTWVAVPNMEVSKGQEVSLRPGVEMGAFESKTLKKKFDNIIFSAGPSDLPVNEQSILHAGSGVKSATDKTVKVEKASGPNAYTISEIFQNADKLDKQPVVIKGKVIKVSEAIMGKNWVHLKDGSGDPKMKLVVTSKDLPKVGDVVTISGTLYKDKDFGSGYKYSVIVEEASITK